MRKSATFIASVIVTLFAGCDPITRLSLRPENSNYAPIVDDVMWRGGFTLDTTGVHFRISAYLWGATPKNPTDAFRVTCTLNSDRQFVFPLSKSVLVDSTGRKRVPNVAFHNQDSVTDTQSFPANTDVTLHFGTNDGVLIAFPATLSLPPISFLSSRDSLLLPHIVVVGAVSDSL